MHMFSKTVLGVVGGGEGMQLGRSRGCSVGDLGKRLYEAVRFGTPSDGESGLKDELLLRRLDGREDVELGV